MLYALLTILNVAFDVTRSPEIRAPLGNFVQELFASGLIEKLMRTIEVRLSAVVVSLFFLKKHSILYFLLLLLLPILRPVYSVRILCFLLTRQVNATKEKHAYVIKEQTALSNILFTLFYVSPSSLKAIRSMLGLLQSTTLAFAPQRKTLGNAEVKQSHEYFMLTRWDTEDEIEFSFCFCIILLSSFGLLFCLLLLFCVVVLTCLVR
jgi:hypothetical protein